MRGFARVGWAAVVVLCSVSGAAHAATVSSETLSPHGSLTFLWSGDPARGCAAVGVCGIRGELTLQTLAQGQSVSPASAAPDLFLNVSDVVRVIRQNGGATVGECSDLATGAFNAIDLRLPGRGRSAATLASGLSSGSCAGPTPNDLAGISIPVRRTPGLFDLSGTHPFAAGPFSGTLISTLKVATTRNQPGGFRSFASSFSPATHRVPSPIVETVALEYRVSAIHGALQTQFAGAADPSCQILDACGTTGSLALSVAPRGKLMMFASRLVHRRVSTRQALADFRRGRLIVSGGGSAVGQVAETLDWPDGSSCRDSVALPFLGLEIGSPQRFRPGPKVPVSLVANNAGPSDFDVLRTHCPGPNQAPPTGGPQSLARGSVSSGQLLSKHSVISLSNPGSFSGAGYTESGSGALELELTLTKMTAETSG